jgi:ABC-type transport system involved in multi-copper enzyme maturation permease subunit
MKLNHVQAVVNAEILWSVRKRKFQLLLLAVLAAATLTLVYPILLSTLGLPQSLLESLTKEMPKVVPTSLENWAYIILFRIQAILWILFIFMAMDSIAGEFEQETIAPLLAKPVSRKELLLGKYIASVIMVIAILLLVIAYATTSSWLLYGEQTMIKHMFVLLLSFVWVVLPFLAIAILLGVVSKSTIVTGLGTFMLYFMFRGSQAMIFKNLGMEDSLIAKALLGWALDLPIYLITGSPNTLPAIGIIAFYTLSTLTISLIYFDKADI